MRIRIVLASKRSASEQGFTLTELLIVLLITSILSAVAIPNFLNQSVKAKQSEAKQVMRTVNQSQAMYRAEHSQFADSFDTLAVGIVKSSTASTNIAQTYVFTYTIVSADSDKATLIGNPKDSAAKAYSGGVWRYSSSANDAVFAMDYCESDGFGITATEVSLVGNQIQCPAQFHSISQSK
jgi:type IV pilus assembly protein PilA